MLRAESLTFSELAASGAHIAVGVQAARNESVRVEIALTAAPPPGGMTNAQEKPPKTATSAAAYVDSTGGSEGLLEKV